MTQEENRARDQAKAQLESIRAMVQRLEHCQECSDPDPDYCDLSDREVHEGLHLYYKEGQEATEEHREAYHDRDAAEEAIHEDPLEVSIREGWKTPGGEPYSGEEYKILLCTGGPAVRIIGDLNQYEEPETVRLQYQDWFTPWENYHLDNGDRDTLLSYARCFYFGG